VLILSIVSPLNNASAQFWPLVKAAAARRVGTVCTCLAILTESVAYMSTMAWGTSWVYPASSWVLVSRLLVELLGSYPAACQSPATSHLQRPTQHGGSLHCIASTLILQHLPWIHPPGYSHTSRHIKALSRRQASPTVVINRCTNFQAHQKHDKHENSIRARMPRPQADVLCKRKARIWQI
jgi:hypothetical protein